MTASGAHAVYPGSNGRIAFTSAQGIETIDPDGQSPQVLQPGDEASWSPTGTDIVYDCAGQACVMASDGSGSFQVTVNGGADPQWTPGADIVFVRPVSGFDQVFTVTNDGGEIGLQQRTSDARDHEDPTYSPTGAADGDELIAYAADGDIWTMEIGESPTNLTHRYSLGRASHPDFSPDGSQIVFSAEGKLYVMQQDGSGIVQVTDGAEGEDSSPVFSPAGGEIAFSRTSPSGETRLMLISGTIESPVAPVGVGDAEPSWQPLVPPLFQVADAENATTATCDPGTVLLGGGHTGISLGDGTGDSEGPADGGSWTISAPTNDLGNPVATFATCGSPRYFDGHSDVVEPDQVSICSPVNPGGDCDYHAKAALEVSCSGLEPIAGGFVGSDFRSGADGFGSTVGTAGAWRADGVIASDYFGTLGIGFFQGMALCLDRGPNTPAIAYSSNTVGPTESEDSAGDEFWSWRSYCPDGSAPVAGGWERTDFNAAFGVLAPQDDSYPDQFQDTDYGSLPTSWFLRVEILGTSSPSDTAVSAVCAVLPSGLEPPDSNGSLTFVEGDGEGGDVVSTASPNGALTRGIDSEPQWLPDASGLVFARSSGAGPPELLLYRDADDSVAELAPGPRVEGSSASFSPDLRTFAFAGRNGGILLGTDTSASRDRITGGRTDRSPAFSPTGETIAFVRGRGSRSSIRAVDEEAEVRRRLSPRGLAASDPDWSPEGAELVFAGRRRECLAIYTMRADGAGVSRLTPCGAGARDPAWSPNGKRIAYVARTANGSAIISSHADGSGARTVERSRHVLSDPDWRPYPGSSGPRGPRPAG